MYRIWIFSNKLDLNQETSLYYIMFQNKLECLSLSGPFTSLIFCMQGLELTPVEPLKDMFQALP
jgi:hypothetical protein